MNQKIHRTKNGISMPICSMETDHLQNTIALFIRKLKDSKAIIERSHSKFEEAMYGKFNTDFAERFIDWFFENFPHYFFELSIRDSSSAMSYIADIVEIIGRNFKVQLFSLNKLLSTQSLSYEGEDFGNNFEDDCEDDYEYDDRDGEF